MLKFGILKTTQIHVIQKKLKNKCKKGEKEMYQKKIASWLINRCEEKNRMKENCSFDNFVNCSRY